jgi:hypothetical protein
MRRTLKPVIGLIPMFLGVVLSVRLMLCLFGGSYTLWLFSIKEISIRFFIYEAVGGIILGIALVIFSSYLSKKWSFSYISAVDPLEKVIAKVALEYFLLGVACGVIYISAGWPLLGVLLLNMG